MTDKKILSAVIKRLDRIIALLDNCYDTGEMSESTRRRLIEMLHTSISDIYSFGKENEDTMEEAATIIPEEVRNIETEQVLEPEVNTIEEIVTEPEITTIEKQEVVTENNNLTENFETPVKEDKKEEVIENRISQVLNDITYEDDSLIELESPSSLDYFGSTDNNTEPEAAIINEHVVVEPPVVQEPQQVQTNNEAEVNLAKEKAQLAELRQQLEDERKRLEEKLLS